MKTPIRILIADDHTVVRTDLGALIDTIPGMTVVGEACNGDEAVCMAVKLKPDVIIMDLMMPKKDGAAATEELHRLAPETRVLLLTSFATSDGISRAIDAGATGAVMKDSPNNVLIDAIRTVASGGEAISAEIKRLIASDPPVQSLTPRQEEVLQSMMRGLTNKDIARQLSISEDRVEQHVRTLLTKLGAANRTEAVALAFRKHLLKI